MQEKGGREVEGGREDEGGREKGVGEGVVGIMGVKEVRTDVIFDVRSHVLIVLKLRHHRIALLAAFKLTNLYIYFFFYLAELSSYHKASCSKLFGYSQYIYS